MAVAKRVKDYLDDQGIKYEIVTHTPAFTAQDVAAVSHISGHAVAKVVMIKMGDQFAMAVLPASRRLDMDALQIAMQSPIHPRLAQEREFEKIFPDCDLGAEPPFGNLYNIPVIVDLSLSEDPQIAFNAGSHRELLQIAWKDFAQLVHPTVAPITFEL